MLALQGFKMFPRIPEKRRGQCGRKPFDIFGQLEPLADPLALIPIWIANKQLAYTELGLLLPWLGRLVAIDKPFRAGEDLGELGSQCIVTDQVEFEPLPSPVGGLGLDGRFLRNTGKRHDARPRNRPSRIVA